MDLMRIQQEFNKVSKEITVLEAELEKLPKETISVVKDHSSCAIHTHSRRAVARKNS